MKALSAIHILRVPRRGSHLSALPSDYSLLSSPSITFFTTLLRRNQLLHLTYRTEGTLALGRGQPPRCSSPSLNSHNTRVRRKPGGHVQTA